jgi:hypothetical protein
MKAQTGWCWSTYDHSFDQHHPVRSIKEASRHFPGCRGHPSSAEEGSRLGQDSAQKKQDFYALVAQKAQKICGLFCAFCAFLWLFPLPPHHNHSQEFGIQVGFRDSLDLLGGNLPRKPAIVSDR